MTDTNEISLDIFYMPSQMKITEFETKVVRSSDKSVRMRFPKVTPSLLENIAILLKKNHAQYLQTLSVEEIIGIIDQAAKKWMNPQYPLRQMAENALPVVTGYDSLQLSLELKRFVWLFRKKELRRFIQSEIGVFGNIVDDFQPNYSGGFSKFYGPDLVFQVFSGNVPGVQIWTLLMTLFVKSTTLGKLSFSEAIMPALFVRTLAEVEPKLADTIAILPWQSGTGLEKTAIELSNTIIVCGGQNAVQSIRKQTPSNKKILSYGYKIGVALIGKEALVADRYTSLIKAVAEDVTIYDQQSCLTPQSIFVEKGGAITPKSFAHLLANELQNYQIKYPRASLSESEQMSINKMRQGAEIEALKSSNTMNIVSQGNTDWTIVYRDKVDFMPSPLNRSINLFAVDDLSDVVQSLQPYRSYLQSAGVAVAPNRLFELSNILGTLGVNRVSAIGEMNHVVVGWHHDGGFNLLDLIHVTDIEPSAESYSEKFDSDIE